MGEPKLDSELDRLLRRGVRAAVPEPEICRWQGRDPRTLRAACLEASGADLPADVVALIVDDRLENTRALELARAWQLSSRPMLALFGCAHGKTTAAGWLLSRVSGARYVTEIDLVNMRALVRDRPKLQRCMRAPLLVIDEIGTAASGRAANAALREVVAQRRWRRTMLIGSIDRAAISARYDAATLARLGLHVEHSGIAVVRFLESEDPRAERRTHSATGRSGHAQ